MLGVYCIFEGSDGAGKSSTMTAVSDKLRTVLPNFDPILTQHPGSTPLGKHIRKLVKFPHEISEDITIDSLSRQMLYMVDTVSFINSLLIPSLESGRNVFADRSSFISAMAYGIGEGLSLSEVSKLFNVITPPLADRLYVLKCPWKVSIDRVRSGRNTKDYFDNKQDSFFEKATQVYDSLVSDPELSIVTQKSVKLENVVYIDTSRSHELVVNDIVNDVVNMMDKKLSNETL